MLGSGAIGVAEVVLAKDVFEAGDAGYGLMLSAMGLGLVVGCYLGASRLEEQGAGRVYGTAIALMAVGIGGAAAAPNVWVAAVLLVLSGVGNGAALVCNAVLIQRGVPDRLRGRAFTVAMSLSYAALGVGMIGGRPARPTRSGRVPSGVSRRACSRSPRPSPSYCRVPARARAYRVSRAPFRQARAPDAERADARGARRRRRVGRPAGDRTSAVARRGPRPPSPTSSSRSCTGAPEAPTRSESLDHPG